MMRCNIKNEKGFSLVELAISVTVIGILIAGVVKGQEVMDNARVASLASKVSQYRSGVTSFYDLFDEYPGDMVNPQLKIPGCAGSACYYRGASRDGNGNGVIQTSRGVRVTGETVEGGGFWEHLSASGIVTDTAVGLASPNFNVGGASVPRTPFGGVFALRLNPFSSTVSGLTYGQGLYLATSRTRTSFGTTSGSLMTPLVARSFDRKVDNGMAGTGSVISSAESRSGCRTASNDYNVTLTTKDCDVLIKIMD